MKTGSEPGCIEKEKNTRMSTIDHTAIVKCQFVGQKSIFVLFMTILTEI